MVTPHQDKTSPLGKIELIAIALGGMIGGGIFSILGVSVSIVGHATPIAIFFGGCLAFLAAYSYAKLASYFKDEGATYSFFKKSFPERKLATALIAQLVTFGYISTLALYTHTFASYFNTLLPFESSTWLKKIVSAGILIVFTIINLKSVKGMGRIEDFLVYTKVLILIVISGFFIGKGHNSAVTLELGANFSFLNILIVSSLTFVAYEGFQLVIHAYHEARDPDKNVPSSIYTSIVITTLLYTILAAGAISVIPEEVLIRDKEFALAAGASSVLGSLGYGLIMFGALLATSSAINGTIFGASRLMAIIAEDGHFPHSLAKRKGHIPATAIITMSFLAYTFILSGGLETIIEFGSMTFIIVSFLMAMANFKLRKETHSHGLMAFMAMVLLALAAILIFIYEIKSDPKQVSFIIITYLLIFLFSFIQHRRRKIV